MKQRKAVREKKSGAALAAPLRLRLAGIVQAHSFEQRTNTFLVSAKTMA